MLSFKNINRIQKHILGINARNCSFVYQYNPRKYFQLANDKVLCKELLRDNDIITPKTYYVVESIGDIEISWLRLNELKSMVIKPSNGSGGNGIMVLKKQGDNWFKGSEKIEPSLIKKHIANILFGVFSFASDDKAIIEELIVSHDFLHQLYPDGVADLRLITFKENLVMAMLRLPTKKSNGKANIHQGGLGIGVDLNTGELTNVYNGKSFFNYHPDSKVPISGKVLPYWENIKNIALKCAKVCPLKYLGVDIVIDKKHGPMVIELNARPGLEIQNVNKKGLNEAIKEICG